MSFRAEPDWDTDVQADDWFCTGCVRGQGCNGDARCTTQTQEDELGPTQGPFDGTKAPPALLNPHSVRLNRRRTAHYLATGEFTWPKGDLK